MNRNQLIIQLFRLFGKISESWSEACHFKRTGACGLVSGEH